MAGPTLIFGAATVGAAYLTAEAVRELLDTVKKVGITRIDTAARYPPTAPGQSEKLLGESKALAPFVVDTKIKITAVDGKGSLTASAIDTSVAESFSRLGLDKFNVLYCHGPDPETPLLEQATALDEHFRKGEYSLLGVSNFPPQMLSEFLDICEEHGFVKPSVYQGQYNLLCRKPETDLFPLLRKHGIVFNAYSPLAGGFLTGRLTRGDVGDTRFKEGDRFGMYFRSLYDKPEMHKGIQELSEAAEAQGLTTAEVGLRWILHHSILQQGDGVILGGSRPRYIEENMAQISRGPLPEALVETIEKVWKDVEVIAP